MAIVLYMELEGIAIRTRISKCRGGTQKSNEYRNEKHRKA